MMLTAEWKTGLAIGQQERERLINKCSCGKNALRARDYCAGAVLHGLDSAAHDRSVPFPLFVSSVPASQNSWRSSMRRLLVFASLLVPVAAFAQFPPQIKNVIVIVQENRTPDNLFHFLTPACPIPASADGYRACSPTPVTDRCYDISPCGLSNQSGILDRITLKPVPLSGSADPDHSHNGFNNMCDPDPAALHCRNDGAWKTSSPAGTSYGYVANPAVSNYDGSRGHLLEPYLKLANEYGWANYMYQTNQGPSFPAHQFIFSGTSAQTAEDDQKSTFISENFNNKVVSNEAGCLALEDATNAEVSPALSTPPKGCKLYADGSVQECPVKNTALVYPTDPVGTFCFHHQSMADLLNPGDITWKYYAPSPGSIWTAPDAIKSICEPAWVNPNGDPTSGLECTGQQWNAH